MKILVFGDSLVSDAIYEGFENWVTKLRKFFKGFSFFNLGMGGETSKDLLKRVDGEIKARGADIIIIRIGTNDARYNNKVAKSVETSLVDFKRNIKKLIKICKKYTNKIIFLGNIPCDESKTTPTIWSENEFFVNESLKKYNDVMKEVCNKEKIYFIDLFNKFRKINYKKLLLDDGLHLNSKGNKKIFEIVKNFLLREIL